MKSFGPFLFPFVFFISCSSLQPGNSSRQKIEFSTVEGLALGKVLGTEVAKLVGQPDEVVHLKMDLLGKEAWLYLEGEGDHKFERLGLLVDQSSGVVQSATWSVQEGDLLYQRESALAHFKGAKFSSKKVGQVAHDYFSDDLTFVDQQSGVSLYVNGPRQTVSSISFEAAVQRVPAVVQH